MGDLLEFTIQLDIFAAGAKGCFDHKCPIGDSAYTQSQQPIKNGLSNLADFKG